MDRPKVLVRCGGCGERPHVELRRGRCERCYDAWIRARPVGIGASCAACGNRRRVELRHFEVRVRSNAAGGRWAILCCNCAASADALDPPARSIESLKVRLLRQRRHGDRRAASVGRVTLYPPDAERRRNDRRDPGRGLFDATELVEEIEMVADYDLSAIFDDLVLDPGEVTSIHAKFPV
jgi:hypothetical protein